MEATQPPTALPEMAPQPERSTPPGALAAVLLGSLGLLLGLYYFGAPLLVLAVPYLVVVTMVCVVRPVAAVVTAFAVSGFIGTITAFLGIPVDAFAGSVLLGLWIAVLGGYLTGRTREPLWLLPALVPLGLYVLITVAQMLASGSLDLAIADFRITVWYMLAVALLAIAPWRLKAFRRLALGLVAIAFLVGLYSLYRYIFGASAEEFELARSAGQRAAFSVPIRFFGSFFSGVQLAAWCASALPLLLAVAFVAGRRWRVVAIAAIGLCAFALLASDVRTGAVAAVVGVATVMGLFTLSRAFAVQRVATAFFAVLGILIVGVSTYAVVISGSEAKSQRFERILDPAQDLAFQNRLTRWEAALEVVDDEPLGHGLGTQGTVGQKENPDGQVGPLNLDSAYLKVGIQQGYLVMLLFIGAQLALLFGIAHRAIAVRDRWRCALGIAACGTLVAQMILFFNGIYTEGVTALAAWIVIGLGVAQFTSGARLGADAPAADETT